MKEFDERDNGGFAVVWTDDDERRCPRCGSAAFLLDLDEVGCAKCGATE